MSLTSLTWVENGFVIVNPPSLLLTMLNSESGRLLEPCLSKSDRFGQTWAPGDALSLANIFTMSLAVERDFGLDMRPSLEAARQLLRAATATAAVHQQLLLLHLRGGGDNGSSDPSSLSESDDRRDPPLVFRQGYPPPLRQVGGRPATDAYTDLCIHVTGGIGVGKTTLLDNLAAQEQHTPGEWPMAVVREPIDKWAPFLTLLYDGTGRLSPIAFQALTATTQFEALHLALHSSTSALASGSRKMSSHPEPDARGAGSSARAELNEAALELQPLRPSALLPSSRRFEHGALNVRPAKRSAPAEPPLYALRVVERGLPCVSVFSRVYLDTFAQAAIDASIESLTSALPRHATATIWLELPVAEMLARCQLRARPCERGLTESFLQTLVDAYDEAHASRTPNEIVFSVDASQTTEVLTEEVMLLTRWIARLPIPCEPLFGRPDRVGRHRLVGFIDKPKAADYGRLPPIRAEPPDAERQLSQHEQSLGKEYSMRVEGDGATREGHGKRGSATRVSEPSPERRALRRRTASEPSLVPPAGASLHGGPNLGMHAAFSSDHRRVIYAPIEDATRDSPLPELEPLRDALRQAEPSIARLNELACKAVNKSRVLVDFRDHPEVMRAFKGWLEHQFAAWHAGSTAPDALCQMLSDLAGARGQLLLMGEHYVAPFYDHSARGKVMPQVLHMDHGGGLGEVVTIAVHRDGLALNTFLRTAMPGQPLGRADVSAFAFDSGQEHAASGWRGLEPPDDGTRLRFITGRAFFMLCRANLPPALLKEYLTANGLTPPAQADGTLMRERLISLAGSSLLPQRERPSYRVAPPHPHKFVLTPPCVLARRDSTSSLAPRGMALDSSLTAQGRQLTGGDPIRPRGGGTTDTPSDRADNGSAHYTSHLAWHMPWLTRAQRDALATFEWPIQERAELMRLLSHAEVAPRYLCGCEFTGAMRRALQSQHQAIVLSVDLREADDRGLHYQGPIQDVLECEHVFDGAFFWPPCTHQVRSDTTSQSYKLLDGRTFWGIAMYIYVLARTRAEWVVIEQPDTIIPDYYDVSARGARHQRVRPSNFGDAYRKPINLTVSGARLIEPPTTVIAGRDPRRFFDFADAEERDRWRSSWAKYPNMVRTLAEQLQTDGSRGVWTYAVELALFAQAWQAAGWPLPPDWRAADGRPTTAESRAYQAVRGPGDGRRLPIVAPAARAALSPADIHQMARDASSADAAIDSQTCTAESVMARVASFCKAIVPVTHLSRAGLILVLATRLAQPLVLAHVNGMSVVGAELEIEHPRAALLRFAQKLGAALASREALIYLAGRFDSGPMLAMVPLAVHPSQTQIVATPARRRQLARAGHGFRWCTLAALAGCAVSEAVSRVVVAAQAMAGPVMNLVTELAPSSEWGEFRVGATDLMELSASASLSVSPSAPFSRTSEASLQAARLLQRALQQFGEDAYLQDWAAQIAPPPSSEVPAGLAAALPMFDDERLDSLPLPPVVQPLRTTRLKRQPRQPDRTDYCPRSFLDLYDPDHPEGRARIQRDTARWLRATQADLVCIKRDKASCERRRPRPIAIGSLGMFQWARNVFWDFTFERNATCGVPLDFKLPIDSHLDLDYLKQRLGSYPDQRLLSYLLEGATLEAYTEAHSVWIPHLASLPLGYASVCNEIDRLEGMGWYKRFDSIPFWPLYFNGQGSVARKLEPDRFRRTTEGGGPREALFDEEGVQALSLNDASKIYHIPRYLAHDARLEIRGWLRAELMLPEQEHERPPMHRHSKWPAEIKPTLDHVMRGLSVLKRAARRLNEPVYCLTDDAKDYFSQLAFRSSVWPQFNVAMLGADDQLSFISERRLGFGNHPSSKIAQRLSDALLHMFREDMDDAERRAAETGQALDQWRDLRARMARSHGLNVTEQQRLYQIVMFTDDAHMCVVGVDRTIRAIRAWRGITAGSGLLMAIPEKRTLGTWARWLGVIFFACLGIVVIPRSKLIRAQISIEKLLEHGMEFGEYRSLVGLIEHFRSVNRISRQRMYGLYDPHTREAASALGPSSQVQVTALMRKQFAWLADMVAQSGGASVTIAITPDMLRPRATSVYVAMADAATDCEHPGLGGFLHGTWWYFPLPELAREHMHITALELLATGFNAIVFAPILRRQSRVVLLSDALATPYALGRQRARSPMLQYILRRLHQSPSFCAVAQVAQVMHLAGDSNPLADSASRWKIGELHQLCSQLGIVPSRVDVPREAIDVFRDCLLHASGLPAPASNRGRRPPVAQLPAEMLRLLNPERQLGSLSPNEEHRNAERSNVIDKDGQLDAWQVAVQRLRSSRRARRVAASHAVIALGQRSRAQQRLHGARLRRRTAAADLIRARWLGRGERKPHAWWADHSYWYSDVGSAQRRVARSEQRERNAAADIILAAWRRHSNRPTLQEACRAERAAAASLLRIAWILKHWREVTAALAEGLFLPDNRLHPRWLRESCRAEACLTGLGFHPAPDWIRYVQYIAAERIRFSWIDRKWNRKCNTLETLRSTSWLLAAQNMIAWAREQRCKPFSLQRLLRERAANVIVRGALRLLQRRFDERLVRNSLRSRLAFVPPKAMQSVPLPPKKRARGEAGFDGAGPNPPHVQRARCPCGDSTAGSTDVERPLSQHEQGLGKEYSMRVEGDGATSISEMLAARRHIGGHRVPPPKPASESSTGLPSNSCQPAVSSAAAGASSSTPVPLSSAEAVTGAVAPRSGSGKRPAVPALTAAAHKQASQHAAEWSASPFFRNCTAEQLDTLIAQSQSAAELGAASATLRKDETTWKLWDAFAKFLGFNPNISSQDMANRDREINALLASFLLWVYPRMKGKQGRRWAKPSSAFQYVLALIRIFKRWGVTLASPKVVKTKVKGLMRAFKDTYGALALAPTRREPMRYHMIVRIFQLQENTQLSDTYVWSSSDPLSMLARRLLAVMWRTGNRLGDLIGDHWLSRASLTWVVKGVEYADPPPSLLTTLEPGDYCRLRQGTSKADQFGETWAPFTSVMPFTPDPENAARLLRDMECERPCHGADRERTPLFLCGEQLPSHAVLDRYLQSLLTMVFDAATAARYSWHSLRIGLATALHAAGCPDDQIMLCCRWSSPESLRLYKRIGDSENIAWVDRAQHANADAVLADNVPRVDTAESLQALHDGLQLGEDSDADPQGREQVLRRVLRPSEPAASPPAGFQRRPDRPHAGPPSRPAEPPSDTSPLSYATAVGRLVMVPASHWPSYTCNELDGRGWRAVVRELKRWRPRRGDALVEAARVHFTRATTTHGVAYSDEWVDLSTLTPL